VKCEFSVMSYCFQPFSSVGLEGVEVSSPLWWSKGVCFVLIIRVIGF